MKKLLFVLICSSFLMLLGLTVSAASPSLDKKFVGKLFLQVEDHGRIWYVSPKDNKRYEITFQNALPVLQSQAVGITDANLNNIPLKASDFSSSYDTDDDGYSDYDEIVKGYNPFGFGKLKGDFAFGKKFKGTIFLQVEQGGRVWYVDFDGYRHEITWENLMRIFTKLSIGITNDNLNKISALEEKILKRTIPVQSQTDIVKQIPKITCDDSTTKQDIYNYNEYVTTNNGVKYDYCDSVKVLTQYSCHNNDVKESKITCDFGCNAGACIKKRELPEMIISCNNTNILGNKHKQEAVLINNMEFKDFCSDEKTLGQYTCNGSNQSQIKYQYCPYGCFNGACNSYKGQQTKDEACTFENCSDIQWEERAQRLPIPNYSKSIDNKGRLILKSGTQFEQWMPDDSKNAEEYGRIHLYQLINAFNNTKDLLKQEPNIRPDKIIQEYALNLPVTGKCCTYENDIPILQWNMGNYMEYQNRINWKDPMYINERDMDWRVKGGNHELTHRFVLGLGLSAFLDEGLAQYVQDRKVYDDDRQSDYQSEICKETGYYRGTAITKYTYLSCNNDLGGIYESGDCFWYKIEKLYGKTAFQNIIANIFKQNERNAIMNVKTNSISEYILKDINQLIIPVIGQGFWNNFKEFGISSNMADNMTKDIENEKACLIK